jgi:hypothetical protein
MSKKNDLTAVSTVLNIDQIANAVLHRLKGRSLGLLDLFTEFGILVDTKYRNILLLVAMPIAFFVPPFTGRPEPGRLSP